jgi:predicted transcriptional regulator
MPRHKASHPEVAALLSQHISSVEELEILLLLRRRADRSWDATAVAEELRTSDSSAEKRLGNLCAGGLVEEAESSGRGFRYGPSSAWKRAAVDQLADLYAEAPFRVIDMIFAKPIANLRVYADAFRYRKDDPDG